MRRVLLGILLLFSVPVFAQVSFQFVPEVYGRTVNGLFNCRIINGVNRRTASLTITVSERKAGTVLQVRTAAFSLVPGANIIPLSAVRAANIKYSNFSPIDVITRTQGYFPAGDYEYCFTLNFNDNQNEAAAEQCFNYELTPFAELNLIEPYDKDKICDTRPTLTWQPLIPAIAGSYYQLVLSEIKADQTPVDALNYNLPLINNSNITGTILPFPSIVPALEKGKNYVWQVTAYKEHTVLNRSEIWQFKVECPDSIVKKEITKQGYRNIEDLVKGNYYVANGEIRFAVINSYQAQKLKYEIKGLNDGGKRIKRLPKVSLDRGTNKITIDLSSTGNFVEGQFYIMSVTLPNGSVKNLRFIYYGEN